MDLDNILLCIRNGDSISESTLVSLLQRLTEVLYAESNVLELTSPITICGDIHAQLYDLFTLFDTVCPNGVIGDEKFLFLGDYVDRGHYSIETFAYLSALKLRYPDQFYLLRGNHECRAVNQMYGFYVECRHVFGHNGMYAMFNDIFDALPMAAVIDGRVFAVHGGLSPDVPLIEKISLFDRFHELPASGELSDLCWSDPGAVFTWKSNQRGAGWIFGEEETAQFCHNNSIDFVIRSHQLAVSGYEWQFDNKIITIWSAPNYMYRAGNCAAVMRYVDGDDTDIRVFDACPDSNRKTPEDPAPKGYFL